MSEPTEREWLEGLHPDYAYELVNVDIDAAGGEATINETDRFVRALREIVAVLGPERVLACESHCEGCAVEASEALRIAREALGYEPIGQVTKGAGTGIA